MLFAAVSKLSILGNGKPWYAEYSYWL